MANEKWSAFSDFNPALALPSSVGLQVGTNVKFSTGVVRIAGADFTNDMFVDLVIPAGPKSFGLTIGGAFASDQPTSGAVIGVLMSQDMGLTFFPSYFNTFTNGRGLPGNLIVGQFNDDLAYLTDGARTIDTLLPNTIEATIYPGATGVSPNMSVSTRCNNLNSPLDGREIQNWDALPLDVDSAFVNGRINLIRITTFGYFDDPQDGAITAGFFILNGVS